MRSYVALLAFAFSVIQLAASGDMIAEMMEEVGSKCYEIAGEDSTLTEEGRNKTIVLFEEARHEETEEGGGEMQTRKSFQDFQEKLRERIDSEESIEDKGAAFAFIMKFTSCVMRFYMKETLSACKEGVEEANAGVLSKEEREQLSKLYVDIKREAMNKMEVVLQEKVAEEFEGEKLEAAQKILAGQRECFRSPMSKDKEPEE